MNTPHNLNILDPDMHIEAGELMAGRTRVEDIRQLTQAFITQRLSNSSNMETTKSLALKLLSEKLQGEEARDISISKLMEIVGLISEHTSTDVSNMVAAFAAKSGNGAGKGDSAPSFNLFFGQAPGAGSGSDLSDRVVGAKSTYRILDALDSVAQQIVSNGRPTESTDETEDADG